jgi:hypothetical protein
MRVSVPAPFDLDIFAYVCAIVSVIDLRYKAVIAEVVSYGYLGTCRF